MKAISLPKFEELLGPPLDRDDEEFYNSLPDCYTVEEIESVLDKTFSELVNNAEYLDRELEIHSIPTASVEYAIESIKQALANLRKGNEE